MECLWFGDDGGNFFDFDTVAKNRKLTFPMLPDELAERINDSKKLRIVPKQTGEKRLLSVDLALMSSVKNRNDASAIFVHQLIPNKASRYIDNVLYSESSEGSHTADQALRVRKLYDMYMCDYIVIDVRGEIRPPLWKHRGNNSRKKTGMLKCKSEWKLQFKSCNTCNA